MNYHENSVPRRFREASLSQLDFPEEIMNRLNRWVKHPKNMLVFSGAAGVGKTHFSYALYNYFKEKNKILFKTEYDFFNEIRNSMTQTGGDYAYRTRTMAEYEVIWILDDIGSSQMTDWQKEVLSIFINARYENMLPTIITTNVWIRDMGVHFTPRIQSRLAATENVVIELNAEDKRQNGM